MLKYLYETKSQYQPIPISHDDTTIAAGYQTVANEQY